MGLKFYSSLHGGLAILFSFCFFTASSGLDYSEVQQFGNSCPQLDSCQHLRNSRRRELANIKEMNCACDHLCSSYGDCCIDAPDHFMGSIAIDVSCYEMKQFGGVYIIDSCPNSYQGPDEVKQLCEKTSAGSLPDPLGSMPVTDSSTGLTYKNYYCSMCNDKTDNIVIWTPRLECPTLTLFNSSKSVTEEYVFQNLASDGKDWGLYLDGENGSLFFHDCEVDPVMPLLLQRKIRLCKPDLISDCVESWPDDRTRALCRSYMGTKFVHGGDGYRNVHCALCNHVNASHLSCQSAEMRGIHFFRQFETHAFSLLLDINEKRGQEVGMVQVCDNGEVYDPFFKRCRSLTCLPGHVRQERRCVPRNKTLMSSNQPDASAVEQNNENRTDYGVEYVFDAPDVGVDFRNISSVSYNISAMNGENQFQEDVGKFQNCLLISLGDEDYVKLPNSSIYVPKYDRIYEPTKYHAADGSILICSHFESENDSKFVPLMGYITTVGLGISMLCLLLHFIVFCMVPDLQNLSGKNLVSQCIALFCAYGCFIIGQFDTLGFTACTVIAFLTFYFFQVSFFWMGVMAYDVWRTLKMATTELRVSGGRQMRRFAAYTFFTWVTPLFVMILIAFAEYTDAFPLSYRPGFAKPRCWFKRRRALLVFFATPLIAIMLANLLLFLHSARMILMTTQTTIKQQSQSQKRNFKLYLRLALLMGLTWVVGLVAGYADIAALWYVFVVLNTLQGLFIFVAFSCTTKVLNHLRDKLKSKCKPREFKSGSSGSACNTSSITVSSNPSLKLSTKLLIRSKKHAASPTNSSA
ncbi:uncharacterized protein LOC129220609 [Uloborus diversus]|uniref:uncharacterized protein LOC129220609 n=1 Tax=Uloborus diversus TaxID=327109 RepID=UPI0024098B35|nr:uncharacterized protein LOC129220609 [Uloborus diversus]